MTANTRTRDHWWAALRVTCWWVLLGCLWMFGTLVLTNGLSENRGGEVLRYTFWLLVVLGVVLPWRAARLAQRLQARMPAIPAVRAASRRVFWLAVPLLALCSCGILQYGVR